MLPWKETKRAFDCSFMSNVFPSLQWSRIVFILVYFYVLFWSICSKLWINFFFLWDLFSGIFKNSQDTFTFLSELFFPSSKHSSYFWNSGYVQVYNTCPLLLWASISSIIAKNQANIFIKKSKIWNISKEIQNRLWPY